MGWVSQQFSDAAAPWLPEKQTPEPIPCPLFWTSLALNIVSVLQTAGSMQLAAGNNCSLTQIGAYLTTAPPRPHCREVMYLGWDSPG